jgi:hypothetical protein
MLSACQLTERCGFALPAVRKFSPLCCEAISGQTFARTPNALEVGSRFSGFFKQLLSKEKYPYWTRKMFSMLNARCSLKNSTYTQSDSA